jgi:hypothetical protein
VAEGEDGKGEIDLNVIRTTSNGYGTQGRVVHWEWTDDDRLTTCVRFDGGV